MNESEKLHSGAIVTVILLIFIGLFASIYILDKNIRPFNGERFYKMHRADNNTYIFIDSLKSENDPAAATVASVPDIVFLSGARLTLNQNPSLTIWMMTIAMMVGTALGLVLPISFQIKRLLKKFRTSAAAFAGLIFLTLLIGVFLMLTSKGNPGLIMSAFNIIEEFQVLLYDATQLMTLIYLTMGIGLVAVFGMLLVNYCITRLSLLANNDPAGILYLFRLLNDSLHFFLMAISVLILFSVITSALIQQSIDTVMTIRGFTLFPTEFIYAYGLIFTIFLAAIYIPIHYHLKAEGKRIADQLRESNESEFTEEKAKQLEMKEPTKKSIQVLLTILAPILGSVFTDLLKQITQ